MKRGTYVEIHVKLSNAFWRSSLRVAVGGVLCVTGILYVVAALAGALDRTAPFVLFAALVQVVPGIGLIRGKVWAWRASFVLSLVALALSAALPGPGWPAVFFFAFVAVALWNVRSTLARHDQPSAAYTDVLEA